MVNTLLPPVLSLLLALALLGAAGSAAAGNAAGSGGSAAAAGSAAGASKKRNVLFVVYDDLSARHNVYGWSQSATPVADEFAKGALVFDRAYCQQAVCSPSRASFLSGRRPDRTRQWTFALPEPNTPGAGGWRNAPGATAWRSFPQWFRHSGYYTAGVGKLYHPGDPAYFDPLAWTEPRCLPNASNPGAKPWQGQGAKGREGFPYYGQGCCPFDGVGAPGCYTHGAPAPGWGCPVNKTMQETVCNTRTDPRNVTCFPDVRSQAPPVARVRWVRFDRLLLWFQLLTLGTALSFLGKGAAGFKRSPSVPFWLGVGFTKPHFPQIFPSEMAALVPAVADIDLPPNRNFTEGGVPMAWMSEIDGGGMLLPASDAVTRQARHDYYAAAAYSDSLLGDLLKELDALGVAQDTAVVLTADHGWGLGEHNHWSKYTNWETDARVPMIVRVPWKPLAMGKRTSAMVEHVDLYPSLAELVGVPVDKAIESIDGDSWGKLTSFTGNLPLLVICCWLCFDRLLAITAVLMDDPSGKAHKKLVAYSQFPRCWPSNNPTNTSKDYDRMQRCLPPGWDDKNMVFMGLSMRTAEYRYTEWHAWLGGETLKPNWEDGSTMIELYDHRGDPPESTKISYEQFENINIYEDNKPLALKLGKQLRAFFEKNAAEDVARVGIGSQGSSASSVPKPLDGLTVEEFGRERDHAGDELPLGPGVGLLGGALRARRPATFA